MPLKLVREQLTLVYGLQLFHGGTSEPPHAYVRVEGPGGAEASMALHTLRGTREELRQQLHASIEAFLELVEPVGGG